MEYSEWARKLDEEKLDIIVEAIKTLDYTKVTKYIRWMKPQMLYVLVDNLEPFFELTDAVTFNFILNNLIDMIGFDALIIHYFKHTFADDDNESMELDPICGNLLQKLVKVEESVEPTIMEIYKVCTPLIFIRHECHHAHWSIYKCPLCNYDFAKILRNLASKKRLIKLENKIIRCLPRGPLLDEDRKYKLDNFVLKPIMHCGLLSENMKKNLDEIYTINELPTLTAFECDAILWI